MRLVSRDIMGIKGGSDMFIEREILNDLVQYIILSLNEIKSSDIKTDFSEGEAIAFIECLEILSKWSGFKKFGIKDIEKHFNIT